MKFIIQKGNKNKMSILSTIMIILIPILCPIVYVIGMISGYKKAMLEFRSIQPSDNVIVNTPNIHEIRYYDDVHISSTPDTSDTQDGTLTNGTSVGTLISDS